MLPGVDLRFDSNTEGYRESFVYSSGTAAATPVVLSIQTQGVSLEAQPSGEINVIGTSGEIVGVIPARVTADRYSSAAEARSSLALPRTPSGYFEVQASRVAALRGPTIAAPKYGMPGGGSEFTTEFPIKIASPFIPFGG